MKKLLFVLLLLTSCKDDSGILVRVLRKSPWPDGRCSYTVAPVNAGDKLLQRSVIIECRYNVGDEFYMKNQPGVW